MRYIEAVRSVHPFISSPTQTSSAQTSLYFTSQRSFSFLLPNSNKAIRPPCRQRAYTVRLISLFPSVFDQISHQQSLSYFLFLISYHHSQWAVVVITKLALAIVRYQAQHISLIHKRLRTIHRTQTNHNVRTRPERRRPRWLQCSSAVILLHFASFEADTTTHCRQ